MTTLMAYDCEALTSARRALLRSLDELRALATAVTDPLTHDLAVHVSWARAAIEQTWLPVITKVLALDVLTPFTPRLATPRSLTTWDNALPWAMSHQGWLVITDPGVTQPNRRLTPAAARALAVRLGVDDPMQWSATDWTHLADLLDTISDEPLLAAHFRLNVRAWAPLLNAFGAATILAGADPVDIARLAVSLGTVLATATGESCADPWGALPMVDLLIPASKALLLPHLGLEPAALAGAAAALILDHPSTAELLLPILTERPEVIPLAMVLLVDQIALLDRSAPPAVVEAALIAAVDPRTATAAQAEAVITKAGPHIAAEGVRPGVLGALIAPWLLAFSPLSRRFTTPPIELARLLAAAMSEPVAVTRLAEGAEAAVPDSLARATLDEAAALVGLVRQLALDTVVGDTAHDAAAWDTLWAAASISAALAGFAPGAGVAVTGVSLIVARWWAPDVDSSGRQGAAAMDRTLTSMAAAALSATVTRWRTEGFEMADPPTAERDGFDDDPSPSAEFLRSFADWRKGLPGGEDGEFADRATRVVFALVSPASSGEHLAEAI